ncbi:hypothetical protein B296_00004170 [Ensete ventricosum]|uniref:Uncharacterized protein n=1 Tax=Ensete ventricosum TaxID=4639 RepID=A0A427BAM7_ENSVE|nr:hypothetical protein B296_00004170 [Ensete ventricosum]
MAMAALQREAREVATLEQRWQQEIAVVEASSVLQALMLAAAKGKKGDGSAKMVATGKKQHWDRWQLSLLQDLGGEVVAKIDSGIAARTSRIIALISGDRNLKVSIEDTQSL